MSGIFISYRRGDTRGTAGRLYDDLTDRFGSDRVFRDLDAIEPGADYSERIEDFIRSCDVLVAVIGHEWLDARDNEGRRRLEDPEDFVRREIVTALEAQKMVIPVLVEDAFDAGARGHAGGTDAPCPPQRAASQRRSLAPRTGGALPAAGERDGGRGSDPGPLADRSPFPRAPPEPPPRTERRRGWPGWLRRARGQVALALSLVLVGAAVLVVLTIRQPEEDQGPAELEDPAVWPSTPPGTSTSPTARRVES